MGRETPLIRGGNPSSFFFLFLVRLNISPDDGPWVNPRALRRRMNVAGKRLGTPRSGIGADHPPTVAEAAAVGLPDTVKGRGGVGVLGSRSATETEESRRDRREVAMSWRRWSVQETGSPSRRRGCGA